MNGGAGGGLLNARRLNARRGVYGGYSAGEGSESNDSAIENSATPSDAAADAAEDLYQIYMKLNSQHNKLSSLRFDSKNFSNQRLVFKYLLFLKFFSAKIFPHLAERRFKLKYLIN
jgi:hypothetical protein